MHPGHTSRLERQGPDWTAAAVSGFAAGAILMVIDLLWSLVTTGEGPWATSHRIAAVVMGPQVSQSYDFNLGVVAVALLAHYALGIVLGLVLAAVSAPLRLDASAATAALTGAVFGVALYFINFHGMVAAFPWFAEMRGWATLAAHVLFGVSAALLYRRLARRDQVRETPRGVGLS